MRHEPQRIPAERQRVTYMYCFTQLSPSDKRILGTQISVDRFLGCGGYGHAYRLKHPEGYVLKITRSRGEAAAAWKIKKLRDSGLVLPGVVLIKDVFHIRRSRESGYGIIREFVVKRRPIYLPENRATVAIRFKHLFATLNKLCEHGLDLWWDCYCDNLGRTMKRQGGRNRGTVVLMDTGISSRAKDSRSKLSLPRTIRLS